MAWFGLLDCKVLLLEKLGGAPKARGKQGNQTTLCARTTRGLRGMRRERPGALLARRTRTMKLCSSDARSRGQPWPLP